jgi:Endonuclease/Exonuclease/phosphatase family
MRFFLSLVSCFLFLTPILAQQQYKAALVGFYNIENLYDTLDNPLSDDAQFLPKGEYRYTGERYLYKLGRLAEVISQLGVETTPDGVAILGMCEIENRSVLEDLAKEPKLVGRNYKIIHYDSPDRRGVDVALIYQPKYFTPISSRPVELVQFEKGSDTTRRYTRDILYVCGLLDGDTVHIMVNHWPSRRGGESASKPFRNHAASVCKGISDSILLNNPTAKIIVMGDLNDDPVNESVAKIMGAKRKKTQTEPREFYNPMWEPYDNGIGTLAYNDAWNLFDQTLLSYGLISPLPSGYFYSSVRVFNEPWLTQKDGAFKGYPWRTYVGSTFMGGYSDHFPVYITLLKKV